MSTMSTRNECSRFFRSSRFLFWNTKRAWTFFTIVVFSVGPCFGAVSENIPPHVSAYVPTRISSHIPENAAKKRHAAVQECREPQCDGGSEREGILGPPLVLPGDLVTFEISETARWCLTPVVTTIGKWTVDSSGKSLYFASNEPGTYTICAAVVVENKPELYTKTFSVSNRIEPDPQPRPDPQPEIDSLTSLVRQKCDEMIRESDAGEFVREKQAVRLCFLGIGQALRRGSLKSAAAARANLRQSLRSKLAVFPHRRRESWNELIEEIAVDMEHRMEHAPEDVSRYEALLEEVVAGFQSESEND